MIDRKFKVMTNLMEGDNNNDSLDSSDPGAVLNSGETPIIESADSMRQTVSDRRRYEAPAIAPAPLLPPVSDSFQSLIRGVPTFGPPPRVTAPLIPPPTTQPLPPPFIEPASSRTRTVAPGEMALPEFPDSDEIETFVLSPSDPVPVGWTSFFIEATDGKGSTLHVENEDDLLANGLRQIRLTIGKEVRHVIVSIGMANTNEVNIGVRRLIKALFNKYPDGFSFRFLVPRSSPKL